MTKRILSKGMLVRKKKPGGQLGPWLRVVLSNAKYVYASALDNASTFILPRARVYKPAKMELCVAEHTIEQIRNGQVTITHDATKSWVNLWNNRSNIELLLLYTQDGWHKIYCTIDAVHLERSPNTNWVAVKLTINQVIYVEPKI